MSDFRIIKHTATLLIMLCIGVYAQAGEDTPSISKKSETIECYINVKLGKHVFRIENRHNTWVEKDDKPIAWDENERRICHQIDSLPVEADNFKFFPTYFREKYDKHLGGGYGFVMSVGASYWPEGQEDFAERVLYSHLESEGLTIEDLPKENGYYTTFHLGWWYIFPNNTVLSPSGNPIAITCSANRNKDPDIPSVWGICGTGISWKDNIGFGFNNVNELHIPRGQWKELYYDFLNYMESLEIPQKNKNLGKG